MAHLCRVLFNMLTVISTALCIGVIVLWYRGYRKEDSFGANRVIVLVDFWATWCGPCIAELKHVQSLQEQYANDPRFVILSISVDDRTDEPKKFLAARNLPWPQAFVGASAWTTPGIEAIPSLWLIAQDGKVIAKQIPEDQLDKTIKTALAARP